MACLCQRLWETVLFSSFLVLICPGHQAICLSLWRAEKGYDERSHVLSMGFSPRVIFFLWFITEAAIIRQPRSCILPYPCSRDGQNWVLACKNPNKSPYCPISGAYVQDRISQCILSGYQCQRQQEPTLESLLVADTTTISVAVNIC